MRSDRAMIPLRDGGHGTVTAASAAKSTECYMNLLYTMEDVAVYGYITPLKVKIIIALALTDAVVRDADVLTVCVSMHYNPAQMACDSSAPFAPRYSERCTRLTVRLSPIRS